MAIDYEQLLRNRRVRKFLGKNRCDRAKTDPDFLPNFISDNSTTVLVLGWDGGFPGGSGANYLAEWCGYYFFHSSDYDPQGPFKSLKDALRLEQFHIPTAKPELGCHVLSMDQLLDLAKDLVGETGDSIDITERCTFSRMGASYLNRLHPHRYQRKAAHRSGP